MWPCASLLQRAHQIEIKQRLEEFAKRERVHKIKVHHFHLNGGVLPTSKAFRHYHLLMILLIHSLSEAKLHFKCLDSSACVSAPEGQGPSPRTRDALQRANAGTSLLRCKSVTKNSRLQVATL